MARTERPLDDGPAPLLLFAGELRRLRQRAGRPTYRQLAQRAHYSSAALAAAASGRRLPSLSVTLAYVEACGGDAAEWERRWRELAADLTPDAGEESADAEAPYVGLAPFQAADADRFFGRERLIADLLCRVERGRFVAVFGASGSGKSSVLRAGVIAQWTAAVAYFTPGPHPLEECALRLAALGAGAPGPVHRRLNQAPAGLHWLVRQIVDAGPTDTDLLIVVDQFEEVFTQCTDADERQRFIEALVGAATGPTSRCRIVIGVRADFYEHCMAHPELLRAFADAQVPIGPMSADELRRAITEPALRGRLTLEGALLAELVAHTYGRTGVLPLLSHALLETWRRRRGNTLTLAGFRAAGGIDGALANTADAAFGSLSPARRAVARNLFTRLGALGDGTQDTKRQVRRDDLDLSDDDVRAVLEHFVAARLITVDRDRIEITHEVLIRCWPRLRRWLTEDRDVQRFHHEIAEAARQWEQIGRDPAAVLRGVRLAAANDWVATGRASPTPRERAFLAASVSLEEAERAAAQRQSHRLRRLVVVLSALLVLVTATTVYARWARQSAVRQRDIATAQNATAAASGLRLTQPALANQLLLAAYRLAPTEPVRSALMGAFALPYDTVVGMADGLAAMATDGRTVVTADTAGRVHLTDATDPHHPSSTVAAPADTEPVRAVAFSPDGRVLAYGGANGTIRLWDTTDLRHWHTRPGIPGDGRAVSAVAFSPDGRRLAVAAADGPVRLWDVTGSGPPRQAAALTGHRGPVRAVAYAPDGHTIATAGDDATLRLWTDGAATVVPVTAPLWTVAFSPDGRRLAAAGRDGSVLLWSMAAPDRPAARVTLAGHTDAVTSLAFSPDGRTLASGSVDATVRTWDVRDAGHAGPLLVLGGHIDTVTAVAFGHGGQALISASRDHTMRLWDLPGNVLAAHESSVYSVATDPNGRTIATASYDRTVRLWDVHDPEHPRVQATLRGHDGPVNAVTFDSGGRLLASASDDGTVRLWDVADPAQSRPLSVVVQGSTAARAVAFVHGGGLLAVGLDDGRLTLWDARDGVRPVRLAAATGNGQAVRSVAFDPPGRLLAAGGGDGLVSLWDMTDVVHPVLAEVLTGHTDAVRSVAFSPDGRTLVTASEDRTVQVWNVAQPRNPVQVTTLTGDTDGVESVAFSPDGHVLATASSDRLVRLWDVTDQHRIHEVATLSGHAKPVDAVAFSRDGRSIITGSEDWTALVWRVDPEDVATRICGSAYPMISQTDWVRFFPGIAYRPPCRAR